MRWKTVKLGNCCEIVLGATPDTNKKEFWNGEIFWATPKDLSELDSAYISSTPRKLTKAGLKNCSANILPEYSVLFSSRAPIGHVAVNTIPMCTNQGFKSFVPNSEIVFYKYLYYWLKSNVYIFENLGNGATFKEVSKAQVLNVEIPLPPLDEQKRIAEVLDKADALREKCRLALQKQKLLVKSLFQHTFREFFEDSQKKWFVELQKLVTVIDYRGRNPKFTENGIPMITASNVRNGYFSWYPQKFVTEKYYENWMTRGFPKEGDILFVTEGATLGFAAKLPKFEKIGLAQRLINLRCGNQINSDYLLQVILGPYFKGQVTKKTTGSSAKGIRSKEFKKIRIPLPPIELQQRFSEIITKIQKLEQNCEKELDLFENLFQSLQQKAFKGELFKNEIVAEELQTENVLRQGVLF